MTAKRERVLIVNQDTQVQDVIKVDFSCDFRTHHKCKRFLSETLDYFSFFASLQMIKEQSFRNFVAITSKVFKILFMFYNNV